ncbi:MAG TPA: succinyl-diaminopimelate desuccinylase [Xanthomonadaceae bacterium]|nr:succinyl-diaminopimelate desuccinylase [Xanthomonadaceae bacterium]
MSPVLELASALIARRSVTPDDGGCQDLLATRLQAAGFAAEHMPFGAVSNLLATHGQGGPLTLFLGHTDVVPPGPEQAWTSPPFQPTIRDGVLYGRGAADMKGAVAAFTVALERFVAGHPDHAGRVGLLLTSDEEGEAVDGVAKVVEALTGRGERIDFCIVGESSSSERLGDVVRIGRRGSLHGRLTVRGIQGHVAYPDRARNPVHQLAPALAELCAERWDEGNEGFPPTTFQISNLHAGTGALNVVPGEAVADFNFRFGTASTEDTLRQRVTSILQRHGLDFTIEWQCSALPFLTTAGRLLDVVRASVSEVLGVDTRPDTGGGTSDGRFVAPTGAEVIELGPINASIHQIDEHARVEDLDRLAEVYQAILKRLNA